MARTVRAPIRAVAALVPLWALLACASGRARPADPDAVAPTPTASVGDTATIQNIDGRTLENLFIGRFPGVTVARTGSGGLQIRIRGGSNSFIGSNEPLYILDGTPLPGGTGEIAWLNPYDIEKIEVLKNAADLSLYGVRGANGVIRITTKRPAGVQP